MDAPQRIIPPPNVNIVMAETPFDDELSSNSSDDQSQPFVNAAFTRHVKKESNKNVKFTPKPDEVFRTILDKPASSLTEEQVRHILAVEELERKEKDRLSQELTPEEKDMDLGALYCKWKLEAQRRRQEKMELAQFDTDPLEKLTPEQRDLPKPEVRKIIKDLKHKRWIATMKERGVPLHFSDTCQELGTDRHVCMRTRFGSRTTNGTNRNVVIKQTNSGLKMTEVQLLDQEKLNKEFEEISSMKKKLEEKAAWVREALQTPGDVVMQALSSSTSTPAS